MSALRKVITYLGLNTHPLLLVLLIVALNVFWTLTLSAFGAQFERTAGYQPIDLQNVSSILTPEAAFSQIQTYDDTARAFYWSFFILDNAIPLVVFGSFAPLWVYLLSRRPQRWATALLNSPFVLLPLGVGLFDIMENVAFMLAITRAPDPSALGLLEIGLLFVRLKALCLFSTFGITLLLTVVYVGSALWRLLRRPAAVPLRSAS